MIRTVVLLLAIAVAAIQGFTSSAPAQTNNRQNTQLEASSRSQFLSTAAAAIFMGAAMTPLPASAKEVDPALKGTKADPSYETCVSQCLYECTKPKGDEYKTRSECIPECKKKCATTKQQLMVGTPLKK
mmetsp:Transcript_5071/g.8309  ORF Transcript_5071/g.8309 Transcript_5071/m.8309 type:complete len:129 (-) Transcript_5071:240-626(-)|eukprot:CAMPEP_0119006468 /NCGR_PEP_ID=MMETSP1176-20130426/2311_1 /TAXON_ID=265551 /ORGANISM="Synedropsis recta cf, Strain CCMP1620" /LENGTH=128 /DNA_ID=CAMNT_0006958381 /DNA_START=119 /DNA_END=505 /DNA_ORIENTATION=+